MHAIAFWKKNPFVRLVIPLMMGILLQWYGQVPIYIAALGGLCALLLLGTLEVLSVKIKLKWLVVQGLALHALLMFTGMCLCWHKDIRNNHRWFAHQYSQAASLQLRITEPPIQKTKSYKATATVLRVVDSAASNKVVGKVLIYFKKDSAASSLKYGDEILIHKQLQPIKNAGNPGSFNYERYAGFQQTFHNIYLTDGDFIVTKTDGAKDFYYFIYAARNYLLASLHKYMPDDINVVGVAEALLIGYKEDLNKELVQAYTNTGIVHIIAISGLHLAMLYGILEWMFGFLPVKKNSKVKILPILILLWLFALLTGASASVLRSAVMLSCILIGKNFFKTATVYNSLAASAFLLLCYNPYFLWDVGFQLSYFAVFGIVWLQQPIYRSWYIKNWLGQQAWKAMSVTLAAQLITLPICLYYFHQFPTTFIISNFIALPLSGAALYIGVILFLFSWFPFVAKLAGYLLYASIWCINFGVEKINGMPYALLDNLFATPASTVLLYLFLFAFCVAIMQKKKYYFLVAIAAFAMYAGLYSFTVLGNSLNKKMIVYNVPKQMAIDFIAGDQYIFAGDSALKVPGLLQNFHLKPSRVSMQLSAAERLPGLQTVNNFWLLGPHVVFIANQNVGYKAREMKIPISVLVLSKNAPANPAQLLAAFAPQMVVADGNNSMWKIAKWKTYCENVHLRFHAVSEKGAYVFKW